MLYNAVFCICLLIFYFSLLEYTYHYNYRSHISLQVAKFAKSAGVQILIFPTVCECKIQMFSYVSPRLQYCSLTEKSCAALASAVRSTPCSLKTLDLSGNPLHDAGIQHLSELLKSPHCKLETL